MAAKNERYEAVRPGLWDTYVAHLKYYSRKWDAGRGSDEWLALLPVGAEPSAVVDHLTNKIIEVEPWYERYAADAWMEAGITELDAQLATVLSSHGHEEVRPAVGRVMWGMRKRSPDDVVRDLMRRGVSPRAAYETVLKHCQWDNWHAGNSARAAEIQRKTLSPLSEIEADPRSGWFARLRRRF